MLSSLLVHQVMSDQVCLSHSEREVCQFGLLRINEDQVIQYNRRACINVSKIVLYFIQVHNFGWQRVEMF